MESLLWNTWYYTLSTIAQVFASILWLYSVFVIFKIEKINDFIQEIRSILINLISSVETHVNINKKPSKPPLDEQTLINLPNNNLLERAKKALLTAKEIKMNMSFKTDKMAYRNMNNIPITFSNEIEKKSNIIYSFKINLVLLLLIIVFSLVSLGFSDYIILIKSICLINTILFLSIIFSILWTIMLAISILKIIKD